MTVMRFDLLSDGVALPENEVTQIASTHTFLPEGHHDSSLGFEIILEVSILSLEVPTYNRPEFEMLLPSREELRVGIPPDIIQL